MSVTPLPYAPVHEVVDARSRFRAGDGLVRVAGRRLSASPRGTAHLAGLHRRFRVLVALAHDKYANAPSRANKSIVIKDIVDSIHNGGGRFLQRLGCNWVELDDKQTHDKVGHALRDMAVASKSKSSSQKPRKNSIDYSDQSNSSKTSSRADATAKSNLQQQTRIEDKQNCVDGYIVSFPKAIHSNNKAYIPALEIDPNDFVLDETDDSSCQVPVLHRQPPLTLK